MKKVLTVGVFDLLHIGHIELFRKAKAQGDYLIVAVQDSADVLKYKPQSDLVYSTEERCYMVKAIRYVDIFPIDGAPEGKLRQRLYQAKYKFLTKMLYFHFRDPYRHGHGPSCWIPLLARKCFTMKGLQESIKRHMMLYDFNTSRLAAVNHNDGLGSMVDREKVLGEPTPIEFEGCQVMGMRDNHSYLTQLFGDYMTPPPANHRHQHNFHFMDLNLPYREYRRN